MINGVNKLIKYLPARQICGPAKGCGLGVHFRWVMDDI